MILLFFFFYVLTGREKQTLKLNLPESDSGESKKWSVICLRIIIFLVGTARVLAPFTGVSDTMSHFV